MPTFENLLLQALFRGGTNFAIHAHHPFWNRGHGPLPDH